MTTIMLTIVFISMLVLSTMETIRGAKTHENLKAIDKLEIALSKLETEINNDIPIIESENNK